MDHTFKEYDFEPWYQKRKLLWKSIQMPLNGTGVDMIESWSAHSQLYKLMTNADQYAIHIAKEETNCRQLKKQTCRHRKLIKTFEETVEVLEDMTLMYRLSF